MNTHPQEQNTPTLLNATMLLLWLIAAAVAFLPFALNTSPWNAITLHVPGNQGNWWHFLAGAPFFLAFPMIWLRLRALFATQPSTPLERRLIGIASTLSILGTILVELPFLLHLAGTSAWQRLTVLSLGFGVMLASSVTLWVRRRHIPPTRSILIALNTAYLANATLCLVVYNAAPGPLHTRSGWLITSILIWPITLDLITLFIQTPHSHPPQIPQQP